VRPLVLAVAVPILWNVVPTVAVSQQLPFGDVPPGVVTPSYGCAAAGHDEASRRRCLIAELRYVDRNLNQRYHDLRRALPTGEALALQTTQRQWLRQRDAGCGLDARPRDRERWVGYLATSEGRASCVLRMTATRAAELESLQSQLGQPLVVAEVVPPGKPPAPTSGEVGGAGDADVIRSAQARRSGRHYFEVTVDHGLIRDKLQASLVARVSDGVSWVGASYDIRPQDMVLKLEGGSSVVIDGGNLGDIRLPKVVIGVAADLDAGRLYRHSDGAWLGGAAPGSPHGDALRPMAEFRAELSSTVPLKPLIEQGIVTVNFGDAPFLHQPAGYAGFDATGTPVVLPPAPAAPALVAPRDYVAGTSQQQWIRRYWEWVRSFSREESPTVDTTGYRCGAGQSGPVWFLTGSREPKSLRRECEVPAGKVLLVPIVNTLAQANPGVPVTCEQLLVSLRRFAAGVTDLRLKVNGVAVEGPERFLRDTGCFRLRDASSGHDGMAAGTGYWVFIKPLGKGRHELEFGGRFTTHVFHQDISYVLYVR
jgi:uncharacterized protein YecT (DUF1311 family)